MAGSLMPKKQGWLGPETTTLYFLLYLPIQLATSPPFSLSFLFDLGVSLKLAKKEISKEEALEKCRAPLASAMKHGLTLVVAMTKCSPAFSTHLNSDTEFPAAELFKGAGKGVATNEWAGKLFREADTADTAGLAIANPDFRVVLTTAFESSDIKEFLFDEGMGLSEFPAELFQIIIIEQE